MFDAGVLTGALGDDVPEPTLLRAAVVEALEHRPGPQLLAALTALAPCELSSREQVEVVKAWTALGAHVDAGRLQAVAALHRVVPRPRGSRYADSLRPAANELAPALGMSKETASRLVGLARRAETELAAAADALADGEIDLSHLRVLAAVTRDAPTDEDRRALEQQAIASGHRRTPAQLRHDLDAAAAQRCPEWFARRAAAGRTERDVRLGPSPLPGCVRLTMDLPLIAGTAVWLALNGAARAARTHKAPDDARTLAQLRADVVVALVTGGMAPGAGTTGVAADPPLAEPVVVPGLERLAELAEVHLVVGAGTVGHADAGPAVVPGVGVVDVPHALDVTAQARWRKVLADPASGVVLDVGTRTYRPPAALRRFTFARDGTCVAPACTTPAQLTQVDHTDPFARDGTGGSTSAENTGAVCDRDHEAKTHLGWRVQQPGPGRFVWTSPAGLTYDVPARSVLPGWEDEHCGGAAAVGEGRTERSAA